MDWAMDVFQLFNTTEYTFIETRPVSGGLESVAEYAANGVVKYRDGKTLTGNTESYDVTTTLHIRPDESFIDAVGGALELVGHAVRIDGIDYRIDGVTTGTDFDTGLVAFYRATLEKVDLWVSELPTE